MTKPKPAYLVASSYMPEGHGSLDAYGQAVHPLLEKYGGELLVAGWPGQFMDHYEGRWNQGALTLFQFPSRRPCRGSAFGGVSVGSSICGRT